MVNDSTHRWPKVDPGRTVNWYRGRGQETSGNILLFNWYLYADYKHNDSNIDPTDMLINKKLLSVFQNVKSLPLKRIIIQYWRQVKTTNGKRLLTCSGNPFAVSHVNRPLWEYRTRCTKFYYAVDEVDSPMIIIGAPPARAIKTFFPEVVLDLRVHRGTPLVDFALECELTCFMMIPVFNGMTPVGVIEVSARLPAHLVVIFNELRSELKRVGLSIYPPHSFMHPCKAIAGDLNLAKSEIGKALQVATELHLITLGQVWAPYESYRGRMLLGKLKTSCHVDPGQCLVKRFYRGLPYLPLKKGEGLVGRTLQTHQSLLCRNIYSLSCNKGILAVLSAKVKCTCFVICLRSSHTGQLDYAFEFFWPQTHNHLALVEALLLTLKEHLPSFKYSSGAQLGDELLVLDVHNSESPVMIFPSETRRESVEGQSKPEGEDEDGDDDDYDLTIFAVYKVECRLFFLPSSSTFKSLMEKINQEFELNPAGTYKMEYQVLPGEWYGLTDDTCLKTCISSYQASKNIDHIKLHVLAVDK